MRNRITLLNSVSALILQIVTIISGFIIPKIILIYFGSSVNGLISSLLQFLSYISLVEGGVTGVIYASLYKPIINKDNNKINSLLATADRFYKKIGFIFILYSIAISVLYPLFINGDFGFIYVFTLTLILSITLFIQYMFSITLKTLLIADKKVYIVSFSQVLITIVNIILTYLSAILYPNIHLMKFISGFMYILQPIIYNYYIHKNYNINLNTKIDNSLLKNRWNGFAINIAAFIHNSTDITILTLFSNLKLVSVYSIYFLVINGLGSIVKSISAGIEPTIGQSYAIGDKDDLNFKMDLYEFINLMLVGFLFTVGALQITPFVHLYTRDILDMDYYQPIFGYILILSEALYLIKFPHLSLAYSANKFKEITRPAYIEAAINIIISVLLVRRIGLLGVAIGTLIAMVYRLIFHIKFTTEIISGRSQSLFYKKLLIMITATSVSLFLCRLFNINQSNFLYFIYVSSIYSIIVMFVYFITALIFFKKEFRFFFNYLKRKAE